MAALTGVVLLLLLNEDDEDWGTGTLRDFMDSYLRRNSDAVSSQSEMDK